MENELLNETGAPVRKLLPTSQIPAYPFTDVQEQAHQKIAKCLNETMPDADMAVSLAEIIDPKNLKRWILHNFRAQVFMTPLAVVFPRSTEEVSKAVRCAMNAAIPVKASSGRHSYIAYCNPCVLLNTYHLKEVTVTKDNDSAVLGAGLDLGQAYTYLADEGYTIPGGTCPTVGLAGLALGGGKGILLRQYGLLSDQVYGIDAVLYNGTPVHADENQHEDLLWIARGGGGDSFPGIVTGFHFHVQKVPPVVTEYHVEWDDAWTTIQGSTIFTRGIEVVKLWQSQYLAYPDWRVYCRLTLYPYEKRIAFDFKFNGITKEEALRIVPLPEPNATYTDEEQVIAPDRAWWGEKTYLRSMQEGGGIGADFTSQGCPSWSNLTKGSPEWEARARKEMLNEEPPFCTWDSGFTTNMLYRSLVMKTLSDEALNEFIGTVANAPYFDPNQGDRQSWHFYLQIDPTNGYAATIAPEATPYPHRNSADMTMQVIAKWGSGDSDGETANPRSNPTLEAFNYLLVARLQPYVGTAAYYNYLDDNMPGGVVPGEAYFGNNLAKVLAIRHRYEDPRLPIHHSLVNNYGFVKRMIGPITNDTVLPWTLRGVRPWSISSVQDNSELDIAKAAIYELSH